MYFVTFFFKCFAEFVQVGKCAQASIFHNIYDGYNSKEMSSKFPLSPKLHARKADNYFVSQ
jgi:hypothetical protein